MSQQDAALGRDRVPGPRYAGEPRIGILAVRVGILDHVLSPEPAPTAAGDRRRPTRTRP